MEFKFTVAIKIQKPIAEVFDAVYNPKKLSGYFTNGGASAPLDEGTVVTWAFADHPEKPISFPVKVKKTVPNKQIQFTWGASEGEYDPVTGDLPTAGGYDTLVEMNFESLGPNETLVSIREGGWRPTEGGLLGSYQNCQGWTHMSMCLKAYLEFGINLRKGSF
jgi:uncharacterized protein YndB with AHSA1/START domain